MADYDTDLETWGATGTVYPSGYSYIEGEQPVDDWDNFLANNTVEDIQHLIELTNKRLETGSGTSFPTSPDVSHVFYRSDDNRLYHRDDERDEWNGLLKSDGDTLEGDLDAGGHKIENIGSFSLSGEGDLSGNDLKDSDSGKLLYDSSSGHLPLNALEHSEVNVNLGEHLSGGGTLSLGGEIDVDVDDDFLLNTGDRVKGELIGERSASSRVFTATDSDTNDKLSLRVSSSDTFQLVGYNSDSGAWDYNSSLSYNPRNAEWSFGSLPSVNGNNMATQTWVNSNANVPDADHAENADKADYANEAGDADTLDGQNYSDIQSWVVSQTHGADSHDSDSLHNDSVGHPSYSSEEDVPDIPAGHTVFVDGDLYIEDGT